ncbi:MAG: hypothetical protein HKN74_13840 [Acidimicrobiia bacterium]|nr:hypothetical protein [Acidimicrobiia bacterium]MBT8216670.1 hypothetical protein [Acidimicrobiia bacterium]NNF11356.1 hypothetical protein [Acidimicrobiia bacterium]NNL69417.1 hypothetical protein [Acidimicrobiia bacterium]
MIVRGVVEATNDLDIICRGVVWEQVRSRGTEMWFSEGNPYVEMFEGLLTFGTTWKYGVFDLDVLIDTAEWIDGLPFVRLEHVVSYKRAAGRPKDLAHLEAMAAAGLTA